MPRVQLNTLWDASTQQKAQTCDCGPHYSLLNVLFKYYLYFTQREKWTNYLNFRDREPLVSLKSSRENNSSAAGTYGLIWEAGKIVNLLSLLHILMTAPYVRTLVHTPVASCLPWWYACTLSFGSLNSGFTSRPLSLASSSPHPLFGSLFGGLDFKGSWLMRFSVLSAWGLAAWQGIQLWLTLSSLGLGHTAALSAALGRLLGKAPSTPFPFL